MLAAERIRGDETTVPVLDDKRDGIPLDQLAAISAIMDDVDWVDQSTAQAALDDAATPWTQLAEHMR